MTISETPQSRQDEHQAEHDRNEWTSWAAIENSGFSVRDPEGRVDSAQIGEKRFAITTGFRFDDAQTLDHYRQRLITCGHRPEDAARMLDEARTVSIGPSEMTTDLASVPRFMGWFEASYGRHTLAAVLHDELIVDEPNGGALKSDTLSDSFFRDMMGVAGVPFFKRWLMWAAVATRTRWAAGDRRRWSLIAWIVSALVGSVMGAVAAAAIVTDIGSWDRPVLLALGAVALPFVAGFLWGRQYGASIVAAAAGIWLIPAAVIVFIGLAFYEISERAVAVLFGPSK